MIGRENRKMDNAIMLPTRSRMVMIASSWIYKEWSMNPWYEIILPSKIILILNEDIQKSMEGLLFFVLVGSCVRCSMNFFSLGMQVNFDVETEDQDQSENSREAEDHEKIVIVWHSESNWYWIVFFRLQVQLQGIYKKDVVS